ncbi:MAG: DegV family protein [Bacillota bacterium]|nr:DegV family protein [Bacillota bacterium]
MAKIALVTDSTAFLDKETLEQYNIEVVPLYVNFENEVIVDGTIDNATFFYKMKKASKMPFTSQPSPGDFVKVYERLIQEGKEVISIHISSGISGTVESANNAAKIVGQSLISVVDSHSTSAGLAMMLITAAKALEEGRTREEVVAIMEGIKKKISLIFVPDTLEYLKKGGRIGGAQALLGTLLQIKPVLCLINGKVEAFDKVRTMKKALQRIVNELPTSSEGLHLAMINAETSKEHIEILEKLIEERLPGFSYKKYELSPVIGTHTGPGVVGLAFYQYP